MRPKTPFAERSGHLRCAGRISSFLLVLAAPRTPLKCLVAHASRWYLPLLRVCCVRQSLLGRTDALPSARPKTIVPGMARIRSKMAYDPDCTYDAATQVLTVIWTVFRKGVAPLKPSGRPYEYTYTNVPEAVADSFLDDRGNGEYYNAVIRGHYTFTRIH